MNKRFIVSSQGYLNLQTQLSQLLKDQSSLIEELNLARDGDISENHPFLVLQEKMEKLSQKISGLQTFLEKAEISERNLKGNFIELGSVVTYQILEKEQKITVELTDEIEADPAQGKISITSPIGSSLSGKKLREISEVKVGKNIYKIQVLEIK